MSFEGLQERLFALQETTTQLKELIDRLANLKFQPGAVPVGADEENSVSGELSAEIGQMLRGGFEEQDLLQEEVKYVRAGAHEKARLQDGVARLAKELQSCRFAYRKARLSAKKSLEAAQRVERELFLQSFGSPADEDTLSNVEPAELAPRPVRHTQHYQPQQSSLSEEDQQTVGASSNVTSALRRTHDLIAAELSRSEFAYDTLAESSAALKELDQSYGSLDGMLAKSRDLLGTLLKSQKSDTWYLQTSLYMLFITGAWLVFRRLLYGPMWWLVWLPLKMLFGVGTRAGSAVMGGRGPQDGGVSLGSMEEGATVEGLPSEDLPTAKIGHESEYVKVGDPDSMVEQVGQIVDEAEGEARNTKKRMWEEEPSQDGKDEL